MVHRWGRSFRLHHTSIHCVTVGSGFSWWCSKVYISKPSIVISVSGGRLSPTKIRKWTSLSWWIIYRWRRGIGRLNIRSLRATVVRFSLVTQTSKTYLCPICVLPRKTPTAKTSRWHFSSLLLLSGDPHVHSCKGSFKSLDRVFHIRTVCRNSLNWRFKRLQSFIVIAVVLNVVPPLSLIHYRLWWSSFHLHDS